MTFEKIDEITKGRKDVEEIKGQRLVAIKALEQTLKDYDKEKARLNELMKTKDEFLRKRDKEALERLADVENAIIASRERIKTLADELTGWVGKVLTMAEELLVSAIKTAERACRLIESADAFEKTWRNALESIQTQAKQSEKLLIQNSETEKKLLKREEEVEKKSKNAEETLKQAKEFVFWHKKKDVKIQV